MTQLIGAGNRRYAVLVTDRRYTENGSLRDADDDDRNKMVLLRAGRLKLAIGFTGLARAGSFETGVWLAEAIHRNLKQPLALDLRGLTAEATDTFGKIRASSIQKLCWVLMVGFHDHEGRLIPTYGFMSNVYRQSDGTMQAGPFQFERYDPPDDRSDAAYAMASHPVVKQEQTNRLVALASRDVPPRALVELGVDLVRRGADDPAAGGTIGKECSSAVIWADDSRNTEMDYHATRTASSVPTPFLVSTRGVTAYRVEGTDGPAAHPARHKRAPCPCGSGRRYGECHMRLRNRTKATIRT